MDYLTSLPTYLSADIVCEWLPVSARVKLDSVYCNHTLRKRFLDFISNSECSVTTWTVEEGSTDNIVRWANTKSVSVQKIFIRYGSTLESNLDLYDTYLKKFGQCVSVIKAESTLPTAMTSIAYCSNLLVLDFTNCEFSPAVRNVFNQCKNLREFRCNFDNPIRLPNSSASSPLKSADLAGLLCPNLKLVKLEFCDDSAVVRAILELAVNVEVLVLLCCGADYTLEDDTTNSISDTVTLLSLSSTEVSVAAFSRLIARCVNIQHLDLSSRNLTVEHAIAIGLHWKHLRSIDLSFSNHISDEVILALAGACGDRLTELLLCQCYNLTSDAVEAVLRQCPLLTSFGMHYGAQDSALSEIDWSLFSNKTTLFLVYDATPDGAQVADFLALVASHCSQLQHCHLNLFEIDDDFPLSTVDPLVQKCLHLHTLCLEMDNASFGDDDVARWQKSKPYLVIKDKFDVKLGAMRGIKQCFA